VGLCVLENYADVLFDQPQLLRLLPDLIQVPAKEARRLREVRPWASSFVRSLISISDQGSPEFASMGRLLIGEGLAEAKGSDFQKQDPRCIATPGVSSLWVSIGQGSDDRSLTGRWLTLPFSAALCIPRCADVHGR
jgi:hypothetical protein